MIRIFLSALFFTEEGNITSLNLIKHITNFQNLILNLPDVPSYNDFLKDITKVCPLWTRAQKFNSNNIKKTLILKTHSFMGKVNNFPLTTKDFTKGFIYIVRDPRSVVLSNMHHYNFSLKESIDSLFDDKRFSLGKAAPVPEIISSWKNHYISWKKFSSEVPGIIVKYEDLLLNKRNEFMKIYNFLEKILFFKFDELKFNNAIKSLEFKKIKKLEEEHGFDEKLHGDYFFRKGITDEWKDQLPKNLQERIENSFGEEMQELGYIN